MEFLDLDAYERLSKRQQNIVSVVEQWAKDNNILNYKGNPLMLNRKSDNEIAAFNGLLKQAFANGFRFNEKNENEIIK